MADTVPYWDSGEFIATSFILGVPHPPGSPLYLLIGNFFSSIPIFHDIGARVTLISPVVSALSVMFLYLIIVLVVNHWRGKVESFQRIAYNNTYSPIISNNSLFVLTKTFKILGYN